MARKFLKYGQVERFLIYLQNIPIYYAKYKKEESKIKALMELIKEERVTEVKVTEEKNVNMRKGVTLEHCFRGEETRVSTRKNEKNQDGSGVLLRKKEDITLKARYA